MEIPKLQKTQSSYDLIIPQQVENKIRTLLREIYNTEWSGVLFYTYTGSFETNDLVLTCQDIIPMNIGSSVYTEFDVNSDVAAYMVTHDLVDCQMGLIHSHHTMSTFFSGTDDTTLYEEGKERNNFLSLIVNNAGKYSARITEKENVTIKQKVKRIIPFFGIIQSKETTEENEVSDVLVKYHDLRIVYAQDSQEITELSERIKELQAEKSKKESKLQRFDVFSSETKVFPPKSEPELFDNTFNFSTDDKFSKYTRKANDVKDIIEVPEENEEVQDCDDFFPETEMALARLITGNLLAWYLPENLDEELPNINKVWKEALDGDAIVGTDTVAQLVEIVQATVADIPQLITEFTKLLQGKYFVPYDRILEELECYV